MKSDHESSELEVEMELSAAFNYIGQIMLTVPVDVHDKDQLHAALSTCCSELVSALDKGRIKFETHNDEAFFHGLLALAGDIVMEGRLKECFGKITLN